MKKVFFLLSLLIATISQAQVTVVGYVSTQGVANYPTHIDSMGKGGYMSIQDSFKRNDIPCLRRKYGMAVYVQNLQKLYILKDSSCNNVWEEFSGGGGGGVSQIIAGANISISPSEGTGVVTINSLGGGSGGSAPYGFFYDTSTQTLIDNLAKRITLQFTDTAYRFSLLSDRIICEDSGLFNFQLTLQLFGFTPDKTYSASAWIKKNSQNIEYSRKKVDFKPDYTIMTFGTLLNIQKTDTIDFFWQSEDYEYTKLKQFPDNPKGTSVSVAITSVTAGGGGNQDLQSVLDIGHDLVDGLNFQGTGAGVGNTGLYVNAFGDSAALNNTGNYVNAIGDSAFIGNTGTHVNAFGKNAGNGNTFNNVNLFGIDASANDSNQVAFSKGGTNARIDYNCIGENRKYKLPDFSGYFVISDFTGFSATTSNEYTIPSGGNYQFTRVNSSNNLTVTLPDPHSECPIKGQRIVITNVAEIGVNNNYAIDLVNPDGKIYYRGSNIEIGSVGIGETIELYSDGENWRTISSLPEPRVRLDMHNGGDYYINSNGTYIIDLADDGGNDLYFPQPTRMPGSKITVINRDGGTTQNYNGYTPIYPDGTSITTIGSYISEQYVSDGDDWILMSQF